MSENLPPLPVPALKHSMQVLFTSLLPFLEESGYTEEKLRSEIQDFEKSLGNDLQDRLQQYAKGKSNWLDKWWFQMAYHSWREPLPVNSNWFMVFKDHPNQPKSLLHPKLDMIPAGHVTLFQLYRTAGLIVNAVGMKEAIEKDEIPVEKLSNGKSLCMHQYKMMFGWCRVALPGCDTIVRPGGYPCSSRHIIVLFRNQVYILYVYDENHIRYSLEYIQQQLMWIVNDVANRPKHQPKVCVLTGDQRDNWAEARDYLLRLSEQNKRNMDLIEASLFSICIDDWSLPDDYDLTYQSMAHGVTGGNRWYDKTITIMCMSNGKAGMNGEHSPCDALIPSRLMDWLVENEPAKDPSVCSTGDFNTSRPSLLKWVVDGRLEKFIDRAQNTLNSIIRDSDAAVLIFDEYGSEFIKQNAKVSPDAYLQMVLQLAFFKLHKQWTATYETAATRQFAYGRTETIRTCSVQAVAFVRGMENAKLSAVEKFDLLRKACDAHTKYTIMAMKGLGCDRHLLGLKMCLKPGEMHPLLSNKLLSQSTHFRLSTSSLSSGENYNGTGFGAIAPDGYGTNYCIGKKVIKFGLESKKSCRETSTEKFRTAIIESFRAMRDVCLSAKNAKL